MITYSSYKLILIGSSLAGKTTLVKYMRKNTKFNVLEMDEELANLNKGIYPEDSRRRMYFFAPKIIHKVLNLNDIIFFTNTDYFSIKNLRSARIKGFKIIQLDVDKEIMKRRNVYRVLHENYKDVSPYFKYMLTYQKKIKNNGLVDKIIDSNRAIELVVEDILQYLSNTEAKRQK